MMCDYRTKRFFDRIGPNERVKWRERNSRVIFEATLFEMLQGLFSLNQNYVSSGMAKFEDFLEEIPDLSTEWRTDLRPEMLGQIWAFDFTKPITSDCDYPRLIDIRYMIDPLCKNEMIINFEFSELPRDVCV